MVIDSIFVYHFVDPDLKVEVIFRKEGTAENGGIDFEIGDIGTSAHWYWRLKKTAFKSLLILSFFNSFDLPGYSSKSRKIYTLRLLCS